MNVELFHIADCPNYETARQFLKEALREVGLPEEVTEIEVCDSQQAEVSTFLGSPTIRVDGKDVEATLPDKDQYGPSCRTCFVDEKRRGFPSR